MNPSWATLHRFLRYVGLRHRRRCFLFPLLSFYLITLHLPLSQLPRRLSPSVLAASETTAIVAVATSALVPAVPAPCVGTSPAHCALVPFREESLSPVPMPSGVRLGRQLALALPAIGRCQDQSAQHNIHASEKSWIIICRRVGNGTSVW